ncbi:MAG TPA: hypothetical protein VF844_16600 [Ktedonobacteraceae bacterium]
MLNYRFVFGFSLITFMLVLTACGSSTTTSGNQQGQTTPSGTQTVQVTLSDNKVDSSLTTFTAGMPYHFVVTNSGQVTHQFLMIPMGMGMEHMSVDDMHHAALYMYDSVAPGETRMFDYAFAMSTAGQSLEFACGTQGHYEAGMQLPFMVNPHGS